MAQLWLSWGIRPQAMIGHSIGEYVAATLSGVFSLKDALTLVAVRGRLMQSLPKGAMLAVSEPKEKLTRRLREGHYDDLSLAAINGPSLCVVSGRFEAIEALQQSLTEQGVTCRRLHTSHAFHSAMMDPILAAFSEQVKRVQLHPPEIPYISNVTGTWITDEEATNPTYWVKHLRQTVRFAEGLAELLKEPDSILLEVGPRRTLSTLAKRQPDITEQVVLRSLPHPREEQSDLACLLTTLGHLWIAGGTIDWQGFYAHERRHRLGLPTYPFERQRYWIDPPKGDLAQLLPSRELSEAGSFKQEIAEWFYIPSWERSFAPSRVLGAPPASLEAGCCLLFVDECGLGYQLAKRLRESGQDVITVSRGLGFTKLSNQTYVLNPERRDGYDALLQDLLRQGKHPQTIVHLWRVTSSPSQSIEAGLKLGFYSLLFLAQALESTTESIQLIVVTNHMQQVSGEEILCPEKATILGPVKVIPQEYRNISCRSIDVVVADEISADSILVKQLLAELTPHSDFRLKHRGNALAQVMAYRGHYRWEQTFKPVRAELSQLSTESLIREGGVYLITGGLGGIGLLFAEELASKSAKLILTGRSAFPEREQWPEWLATHDENDQLSRKIRKVQALEELGAQVLLIRADVSNQKQMQAAIDQVENAFGQLNGVIHAAGVVKDSFHLIQDISSTECEIQFQPKVNGLLVLEKVLQGQKLDFCILLSSLSSVLGGLGFVAYSAANLFMDAFTQKHNRESAIRWCSVNWDGWHLQEEELNADMPTTQFGATLAELAIRPKEGVEAFRLLTTLFQDDQVVVSTGALQARIAKWINFDTDDQPETEQVLDSFSSHARPSLQNAYLAPQTQIEQELVSIWQELLGIGQVGVTDDFWQLGGHSLLGTQLISRVRKTFQVSLPLQSLFEEPTVAGLANYIETSKRVAQGKPMQVDIDTNEFEEGIL